MPVGAGMAVAVTGPRHTSTCFASLERAVARHQDGSTDVRHLGREAARWLEARLQSESEHLIIHRRDV